MAQKSTCLWFTGLSGSGKTTIARELKSILHENRYFCIIVDGDDLRTGVSWDLTFGMSDRTENVYRAAQICKLLLNNNVIAIATLISPTHIMRKMAQDIIGYENFHLVYVGTPIEVCEERDAKGLYSKARAGLIKDFTGIDSPYEKPIVPELSVNTVNKTARDNAEFIYRRIQSYINEAT